MATPYNILGIDKTSNDYQLRTAFRDRIRQFKIDQQKSPKDRTITAEKFRLICRAYEVLSDYDKRKRYDEQREWISDLPISKYTLQQLAAEPDLALELKQRLENTKVRHINAQDPVTDQTPLYCAARTCNIAAVRYLIAHGADPDLAQRTKSTALHVAAFFGHEKMVQCLLESGADYRIKNSNGNLAEQESFTPEVQNVFIELKKKPFVQTAANQLDWFKNNLKNTEEHIDTQYHVQRQTLLHCACKKGHFDLAKWFIEVRSANLDLVDINLNSALHLAANAGHSDIVDYLLQKGANSTLINKYGMTAEQEGIIHDNRITSLFQNMRDKNMFEMAKNGSDWWFEYYFHDKSPNATDNNGTSILYVACRSGQTSVAKWLLKKGANINVQLPKTLSTPLHGAAYYGHISTVDLLLSQGADISIKNQFGATALQEATEEKVKKLLQQYQDNLSMDKYITVHLYGDGKSSGNDPIAKVQLHCDSTISDLVKGMAETSNDAYRWFSIARSPLTFDYDKTTLISAVCRARHVDTKFVDLPICLIAYTSPRYTNSGYIAKDELFGSNIRSFHKTFDSMARNESFHIKAKLNEKQIFNIKNLLFTFAPNCTDKNIKIDIKYVSTPNREQFQLPECIYLFETKYSNSNNNDKLNVMPTVTINGESNVKLYTWVSNSAYWLSQRNQHDRLPIIGGIHAFIRHVEIIPKSLYLPPDMFIGAAIGQTFERRSTPVLCQYLKIREPDPQLFPYVAYHGTTVNVIQSILMDGLVMPSTVVSNGFRVCPPNNHIPRGEEAFGIADFANAIFVSPSIHYCSDPIYAVTFSYNDGRMIAVLELRVKKDEFKTFPSTVATYKPHRGDNIEAIEWRITCPASIQITGIIFIPVMQSRKQAARSRAHKLGVDPNALDSGFIDRA